MVMVRLMADRYDLPKAERIVTARAGDFSKTEAGFSFVLLRINLAGSAVWGLLPAICGHSGGLMA